MNAAAAALTTKEANEGLVPRSRSELSTEGDDGEGDGGRDDHCEMPAVAAAAAAAAAVESGTAMRARGCP